VAYAYGEPAGVTLQFSGDGHATLWAIGVYPSMRRRGIGRALTLRPLQDVEDEVAGYFSTELGSKLYRTLGFKPTGITVTRYLWMPGAGDLKMDAARAGHRSRRSPGTSWAWQDSNPRHEG
jgi:ribosomal protein S18 acetylase RimI-like enzyme